MVDGIGSTGVGSPVRTDHAYQTSVGDSPDAAAHPATDSPSSKANSNAHFCDSLIPSIP